MYTRSPADENSAPSPVEGQSAENTQLAQEVFKKYMKAKDYRKNYDTPWKRFYHYWAGYQWPMARPDWQSTPVVNYIFAIIQTQCAILTDSTPNIDVVETHPSNAERASILKQVLKVDWRRSRMQKSLYEIIQDEMIYGTAFAKVIYDSMKDRVCIKPVPPQFIYPAPGAVTIEDAEYLIFAQPMPVAQVKGMYPQFQDIPAGAWDEDSTWLKNITSVKAEAPAGTFYIEGAEPGVFQAVAGNGKATVGKESMCTYVEYWHRNPKNWKETWVTVCANGLVLNHKKNPYTHGRFPFVKFVDYPVSTVFWGIGEVHQLEKLQDSVNQRRGQTLDILRLTASPPFVYTKDAGMNPHAFPTMPGIKIPINPGAQYQWMATPPVNPGLFEIQQLDKQDFDTVSGVGEITQGRKPKGLTAASAIIAVQESAMTRLRPKIRFMEESLTEVGELMVKTIQQFYDSEKMIRVAGHGSDAKAVWLKVNEENPDGTVSNDISVGDYEVEIGVGSDLGIDKGVMYEQLKEIAQLVPGLVDPRTLLEAVPGLNQEKIEDMLKRYEDAQKQAQAAQQPPPPGGDEEAPPDAEGAPPEGNEPPPGTPPDQVEGMGMPSEEELKQLEDEFGGA